MGEGLSGVSPKPTVSDLALRKRVINSYCVDYNRTG